MHRFYCPENNITDEIHLTEPSSAHHLKDVLRLKAGDSVIVFDGKGNEYVSEIKLINSKNIILSVKKKNQFFLAGSLRLTVACAIPKKAKFDDIVDKLTQLGVCRIIPLKTTRVIFKQHKSKEISLIKRWERIAVNACQQSQGAFLPVIEHITDFSSFLNNTDGFDLKLMPTLIGQRISLKEIFASGKHKNILAIIGPEGDFTPEEVSSAIKSGFLPVSLGNLVLRVETAAVAVASIIKIYYAACAEEHTVA